MKRAYVVRTSGRAYGGHGMRTYRKLFPNESGILHGHLSRLDREERSLRFMGALSDDAVKEYCRSLNWFRTVVVGFFHEGVLRGSAEVTVPSGQFPILCEVAISVEHAWQHQGIGTELFRRMLIIAHNRAVRQARITCFTHNHRIRHIAAKFGARFRCKDGEFEADLPLDTMTFSSFWEEALADNLGWVNTWFDGIKQVHVTSLR